MASPLTAPGAEAIASARPATHLQPWPTLLALLGLWLLSINQLRVEWTVNPQYTYGWTVPLLALYLFAERWKNRPAVEPAKGRWLVGALLIVIALLLLPLRVIAEAAPDWRLLNWAIALCATFATLATIYHAGGRSWVAHFWIPVCFVLVAVPWPVPIERILVQKLMGVVAAVCVEALSFFAIPAVQQGNVIVIETGKVGVEEACSGVRSLQTTLMAALFLGELFRFGLVRRLVLLGAGLALAFLCNLGRSFFLVWISAHESPASALEWHDTVGMTVLIASLAGLAALCFVLRPRRVVDFPEALDEPAWQPRFAGRPIVFGAIAWLALIEVANEAWYRAHEGGAGVATWSVRWPEKAANFRDIPLGEETRAMLRYDRGRSVAWTEPNGYQWHMIFLRWEPGRASKQLARSHGPEVCLAASGAQLHTDFGVRPTPAAGHQLPMHNYLFNVRGAPLFVSFCLWEDFVAADGPQSTRVEMTMQSRIRDVLHGRRNNGQQVIELAVFGPRSREEGVTALNQMLGHVVQP